MKEWTVLTSDGITTEKLERAVQTADDGAEVYPSSEGHDDDVVALLSRHHNYPDDLTCPLHEFLEGRNEVQAKERAHADPLIRQTLVAKEVQAMFGELASAHEALRAALVDDNADLRHEAILHAEVKLHGVLAKIVGRKGVLTC